jgi:hypothetical protein
MNRRQVKALCYVCEFGSISMAEYRKMYPYYSDTQRYSDLAELVKMGALVRVTCYVPKEGGEPGITRTDRPTIGGDGG